MMMVAVGSFAKGQAADTALYANNTDMYAVDRMLLSLATTSTSALSELLQFSGLVLMASVVCLYLLGRKLHPVFFVPLGVAALAPLGFLMTMWHAVTGSVSENAISDVFPGEIAGPGAIDLLSIDNVVPKLADKYGPLWWLPIELSPAVLGGLFSLGSLLINVAAITVILLPVVMAVRQVVARVAGKATTPKPV